MPFLSILIFIEEQIKNNSQNSFTISYEGIVLIAIGIITASCSATWTIRSLIDRKRSKKRTILNKSQTTHIENVTANFDKKIIVPLEIGFVIDNLLTIIDKILIEFMSISNDNKKVKNIIKAIKSSLYHIDLYSEDETRRFSAAAFISQYPLGQFKLILEIATKLEKNMHIKQRIDSALQKISENRNHFN